MPRSSSSAEDMPFISKLEAQNSVLLENSRYNGPCQLVLLVALFSSLVSVIVTSMLHHWVQPQYPNMTGIKNLPELSVPPCMWDQLFIF